MSSPVSPHTKYRLLYASRLDADEVPNELDELSLLEEVVLVAVGVVDGLGLGRRDLQGHRGQAMRRGGVC